MSRFLERDASALVVVDAQQGPAAALAGVTAVLDAIADLVARARLWASRSSGCGGWTPSCGPGNRVGSCATCWRPNPANC